MNVNSNIFFPFRERVLTMCEKDKRPVSPFVEKSSAAGWVAYAAGGEAAVRFGQPYALGGLEGGCINGARRLGIASIRLGQKVAQGRWGGRVKSGAAAAGL